MINSAWADGFRRREGRNPTQDDWNRFQQHLQNGGQPEQTTADRALPYAGALGTLGGAAVYHYGLPAAREALGYGAAAARDGATSQAAQGLQANAALPTPEVVSATRIPYGAAGAGAGAGLGMTVNSSLPVPEVLSATRVTTPAAGAAQSSALGTAATYGGAALGAYGLYDTIAGSYERRQRGEDLAMTTGQGAASGAAAGSAIPGVGTAIGAIVGGLIGLGSGYAGSDKDEHQLTRDWLRDQFVDMGIYEHTPATEDTFSMGGDGGYRLPDGRRAFEIVQGMAEGAPVRDFTEAEGEAIGALNPLAWIAAGGADREGVPVAGNGVGLLYNELNEGGDPGISTEELQSLYMNAGLDHQTAFEALNLLATREMISQEEQAAGHNALNQLWGEEYYTPEDPTEVVTRVNAMLEGLYG